MWSWDRAVSIATFYGLKGRGFGVRAPVKKNKAEFEVKLRPTIPVCLGVRHPSGSHDQIFFLFDNCWFLAVGRPL
jgi:hypothetical protein